MIAEKQLFEKIEKGLSNKLKKDGYSIVSTKYDEQAYGSRFTVWKSENEKLAIRLTWDGKESWYIVEESTYSATQEPICWLDLVIVPFERSNESVEYQTEILNAVVDEIE